MRTIFFSLYKQYISQYILKNINSSGLTWKSEHSEIYA